MSLRSDQKSSKISSFYSHILGTNRQAVDFARLRSDLSETANSSEWYPNKA